MKRGILFPVVLVVALVAALIFVPRMASAADPNAVVAGKDVSALAESVEAYWTADRIKAAKPMPFPAVSGASLQALEADSLPKGPPVVAPSGKYWTGVLQEPEAALAPLAEETPEPLFGTYTYSYTRYRLFPDSTTTYATFPFKTIGTLFFNIPGLQGGFRCSASVVNSTNRSVVWTAGHCVYTPGRGWHTNFSFRPAYRNAVSPYGSWTVKQAFTLTGWTQNRLEYDHGALVMNKLGGIKIGDRVGWLGFAANISRQQHWHLFGYPSAPRNLTYTPPGAQFDGNHQEICSATWAANNDPPGGVAGDPNTIGVGCDQTGGSSGGPWLKDFSGVGGATNILNGNNSYRYTGSTPPNILRMYGPYFTTGAINLRNSAQVVVVP